MNLYTAFLTIPINDSVSPALDVSDAPLVGIIMPAAWTAAALNLEVSADGTRWCKPYDAYGSAVASLATPVVDGAYAVDFSALLPWRWVRLRSGTSGSPVNQAAARTITMLQRGM